MIVQRDLGDAANALLAQEHPAGDRGPDCCRSAGARL